MVSLKDQLAGLADPEPEIDPESNYANDSDSEVENNKKDDSGKRDHYVAVGKSKLRELELDDEKYKGQKVDRKSLYGYGNEDEENDDDDSEGDEDGDINGFEMDGEDDEDEGENEDEDSEEGSEDEDEDEYDDDSEAEQEAEQEDQDTKRRELKNLMAKEEKQIVNHISSAAKADAEKGAAVQNQMNIYEGALDLRINMQKALSASNILPIDSSGDYEKTENSETLQTQALESLYDLIEKLGNVRTEMMQIDGLEAPKLSKKRNLEDAFENIEALDERVNKFRDTTLDKWSRKIQSSSGAAALQSSRFKSLNQTAAVQVGAVLADMDRLVKRTQVNRNNYKVIGKEEQEQKEKSVDQSEETYIFDDTDFYRLQLKELVDKRMNDNSTASNGVKWAVSKTKNKKNVDTKASKGRKLRYTVHEKIQGFAAPQIYAFSWDDNQRDDLFSSLFGQRVQLHESDEESEVEEEEDVEVEDGIKLFG